jgi:Uncharacterized conserved protein
MNLVSDEILFQFDNSYARLEHRLYSKTNPTPVRQPEMVIFNSQLAEDLNLPYSHEKKLIWTSVLSGNQLAKGSMPIAQAYAGHQFGHFTMLGDGRAILIGEHLDSMGRRYDIQLKGAGPTPYSRQGDGRATLRAMLREYLISESMHSLGIPTSRSLAVINTGEQVYRERAHDGAVLTRVMKSHIRVGTLEYINHFLDKNSLSSFVDYTIQRLYPELIDADNKPLALLKKVTSLQIDLIVSWMRVGFIHGVMNTDNTSLSGETFDYGPCAFMNTYHPDTVFSSIDRQGRYAFGNQPAIGQWNLVCLANALIPIIHQDMEQAVEMAKTVIDYYPSEYAKKWLHMMGQKLGLENTTEQDRALVNELLEWMKNNKADYTQTFISLGFPEKIKDPLFESEDFTQFRQKWLSRIAKNSNGITTAHQIMQYSNPYTIPRNHLVEQALEHAVDGNMNLFYLLIQDMQSCYNYQLEKNPNDKPPEAFDLTYKTYCGT